MYKLTYALLAFSFHALFACECGGNHQQAEHRADPQPIQQPERPSTPWAGGRLPRAASSPAKKHTDTKAREKAMRRIRNMRTKVRVDQLAEIFAQKTDLNKNKDE